MHIKDGFVFFDDKNFVSIDFLYYTLRMTLPGLSSLTKRSLEYDINDRVRIVNVIDKEFVVNKVDCVLTNISEYSRVFADIVECKDKLHQGVLQDKIVYLFVKDGTLFICEHIEYLEKKK